METIDFKKDPTYKAKTKPELITIPNMLFVMIDGKGAPEGSQGANIEFQEAMEALYAIVYSIKFWGKKHPIPEGYAKFTMPPVEGLWWMDDGMDFDLAKPDRWRWTLMHRLPEFVSQDFFSEVVDDCVTSKKRDIYTKTRLEHFDEGDCVQILHIGPYSAEGPTIETMHAFIAENGFEATGRHHELYFGDPRRTAPEKLRTLLRHPIKHRT
ncbi:MAG: hypothetical protein HGA54_05890 [Actinobacteria bacterium]|nr:hypothetical protein [Actinomycetota bacterium]